jgi:hypothetical protein
MANIGYSNPTPVFQPAMRTIVAITNAFPAQVTTDIPHNFINDEVVRLIIPKANGMFQANKLFGTVAIIDTTNFTITIDTTTFDPFVIPSAPPPNTQGAAFTSPQVVPFAELSSILTAATQNVLLSNNVLPGS